VVLSREDLTQKVTEYTHEDLDVPHAIVTTVFEGNEKLIVADREHGRIVVFDSDTGEAWRKIQVRC
jgi:hypothetical protein